MNSPIVCEYCGSHRVRRSRRYLKREMLRVTLGTYPFRCLDCDGRFYANVFLLSRLAYAKCPKCLSMDISNARKTFRPGVFKKLMLTFGAHRCRCNNCRYMFISFRPPGHPEVFEPEIIKEEVAECDVPVNTQSEQQR